MELRWLQYFRVVAEELHFGEAANKLHITQPPLSRQIIELEKELGCRLFNRTKRKVELTEEGRYLLEEVNTIFSNLQHMESNLKQIHKGLRGSIKIGYIGAAMHSVLPEILKEFATQYPEMNIKLLEEGIEQQIDHVASGEIDVGIIRGEVDRKTGLIAEKIIEEDFCLLLSDQYLTRAEFTDLKQLSDEPYIGFSATCAPSMHISIMKICSIAGFIPKIKYETSQINALLRLVECGLGYSIVPCGSLKGYSLRLHSYPLKKYGEIADLRIVYKSGPTPKVRNFLSCAGKITSTVSIIP